MLCLGPPENQVEICAFSVSLLLLFYSEWNWILTKMTGLTHRMGGFKFLGLCMTVCSLLLLLLLRMLCETHTHIAQSIWYWSVESQTIKKQQQLMQTGKSKKIRKKRIGMWMCVCTVRREKLWFVCTRCLKCTSTLNYPSKQV